jgi:hypothetical protein
VDNEEWQRFRVSLKGRATNQKLQQLVNYLVAVRPHEPGEGEEYAVRVIRVDNYLKALARGGQIKVTSDYVPDLLNGQLVIQK